MADAAHPKTGASHKRVGSVVRGKYRVEAFLATGTMANVYSATHRNGAKVALKILHPQLAQDPSLCERFKREGYFANSIGHPGIIRAIDDDVTEDGCAFLVMELLEGESLDERRRRKGGKLPLSYVLPVADALLEILGAAHAKDVVHRDLKPDNVFVTKTGDVKVLDFGLARFADGKTSSDMTAVGMVLGTPAYMPPEQALGRREDVDAQSDLWAVGATLFVVLSGEPVHIGGDAKAKLIATARTAARPLREAAPEIPRAVAAVIDRALAFHKKERWADADAMREALRWARMSLEDRPSQAAALSSAPEVDPIPPPVPTRRTIDDEPTVARAFPKNLAQRPLVDQAPESRDFVTSAPPITLRDVPTSTAVDPSSMGPVFSLNNDPVFSLRRGKEGEESPSTERIPNAPPSKESVPHALAMPAYDPADAMGTDDAPNSSAEPSRSIDINLSFTRPMAAMIMPADYEPPRPAAGVPAPARPPSTLDGLGPPLFPAAAHVSSAPPQANMSSAPPFGTVSSSPPMYSSPPPGTFPPGASSPPEASFGPMMTTTPSLRVQAQQGIAAADSSRRSLAPEDPGPLLSQIVKPGLGRAARILLAVALVAVAIGAVFVVLRARAANANARAATSGATAAAGGTGTAATSGAAGTTSVGAVDPPPTTPAALPNAPGAIASASVANLPDADPKVAAVAAAPAPTASEPVKKKKPKPRRPVPKPAESDLPAAAAPPTATAEPTAAPAPADPAPPPTPKDSLPNKDDPPAL